MSGRYSCVSSWSMDIEAIVCAGTPGRAGGPWWHGHTAANLPGACLDVGLCCLWTGGSAELRRVSHRTPVPVPGCSVYVRVVHPGINCSPWQLSWLCHVCVDLRNLLRRVSLWLSHDSLFVLCCFYMFVRSWWRLSCVTWMLLQKFWNRACNAVPASSHVPSVNPCSYNKHLSFTVLAMSRNSTLVEILATFPYDISYKNYKHHGNTKAVAFPSSYYFLSIQSNMNLCLLNGLLPVSYVFRPLFPICYFAFINICLYTMPPPVLWSSC